ncbi:hypothetical protein QBC35DRAFT_7874 [Podospora australis]|uniref:RING-type domain-containing protein n=1 Tax=Podospora australis TaxID=1536484 RepID=A0AAN6X6C3_9PEZI|nr:hypothetical protein QBC35DRAFT_7874 [Podospora australis]
MSGSQQQQFIDGLPRKDRREEHGCYVPDPAWTFMYDPKAPNFKVTCIICQESELTIPYRGPSRTMDDDTVPCLLPCGHMFGQKCLARHLAVNQNCPSCRLSLTHPGCGHKIRMRPLENATRFWHLPATISNGGKIADTCDLCVGFELYKTAQIMWIGLASLYYVQKEIYEKSGLESDKVKMETLKKTMDDEMEKFRVDRDKKW